MAETTRIGTAGMFLVEGARKFWLRGISYGPFRSNALGHPFPEKEQVERDFGLLRALGANTLRLYHVPPGWLCEVAHAFELRLLVGIPWTQHVRFLDSRESRAGVRQAIRDAASDLRDTPHLLGLLIGNEVPPQVVRWYGRERVERFLGELADVARDAHPEVLVSYASFPMTEYLDLAFCDFVCFNVYLHRELDLRRYLARLQNLAGPRPLVLSEFGADSLREGEEEQARIVSRSAATALELGCAGVIGFSHTDEWHTGGCDIEDWAFGLVTREREPKRAYHALRAVYRSTLPPPPDPAPRVSVVVCAYNAARTLEECLEALRRVRYPDFEVIVVDDGATDGTRAIAERYPEFRLISHENRGLSTARNGGIDAATGDVVAFTDADCAADPDWLTFLVRALVSGEYAGVGGPNLPPPEDHWVAEAVARSPGGPTHVLLTDSEAEHVPGCNMAFWRRHLVEVGCFDPRFRAAGDDVDICWRLQEAGQRIGFAPAALVWHRRRHKVGAYLKQQRGYGHAEGLLSFKHPYRFNALGHSRWLGRIYGGAGSWAGRGRSVIHGGPLGTGLFQTLYEEPAAPWRHLPLTLEWSAAALASIAAGLAGSALGLPLAGLWLAGLAMLGFTAVHCARAALRVDVDGLPRLRSRLLIGALTYLGPLVRALERIRVRLRGLSAGGRVEPVGPRRAARVDLRRRELALAFWNETGIGKEACLRALLDVLQAHRYAVVVDDGWQRWDASIHSGAWVRGESKILVENHGGGKRQVDVALRLRATRLARGVLAGLAGAAALAAWGGQETLLGLLAAATFAAGVLVCQRLHRLGESFRNAVEAAFGSLPLSPLDGRGADGPRAGR